MGSPPAPAADRPLRAARVTLRDLAAAAGVSKSLASRALANYPDVAAATRERVQQHARALGYQASARARALAGGRNAPARCLVASLGLSAAALGHSFYGPVLIGLTAQASVEGLDVHLVALPGESEQAADLLGRLVAEDRADGLVLLTFFSLRPEDVRPLEDAALPFVLINRHFGERPVNCVTPDWAGATSAAVQHLVSFGHRRLALILPEGRTSTLSDHETGWWAGVRAAGLPSTATPVLRFAGSRVEEAAALARQQFRSWLERPGHHPTAFVCMNDEYAHAVLNAAVEAGIAVPRQLSVIGFDDLIGRYATPPLCSFDPHLDAIGAAAASLLAAALRGELASPRRVLMPLDFVCRASCGSAPPPWA